MYNVKEIEVIFTPKIGSKISVWSEPEPPREGSECWALPFGRYTIQYVRQNHAKTLTFSNQKLIKK